MPFQTPAPQYTPYNANMSYAPQKKVRVSEISAKPLQIQPKKQIVPIAVRSAGFLGRIGSKIGSVIIPKMGIKNILGRFASAYGIGEAGKMVSSAISEKPYSPMPTRSQLLTSGGYATGGIVGAISGIPSGIIGKAENTGMGIFQSLWNKQGIRPQFANMTPMNPTIGEYGRDLALRKTGIGKVDPPNFQALPPYPQFSNPNMSISPPVGYMPFQGGGSITSAPSISVQAGSGGGDFGILPYLLMGGLGGVLGFGLGRRKKRKRKKRKTYKGRSVKKR